jgi:hypothetical protein
MIAIPASAQGPEPATASSELEQSGVVSLSGESSPIMDGEDKLLSIAPDLPTVNDRMELSSDSEAISDPGLAIQTITVHGWTNLSRDLTSVGSQGWSSATSALDYMRSGNYLCRYSSCSAWGYKEGRRVIWAWAGWTRQDSSNAQWYTRSEHYFRHGSTTRTLYTYLQVYF